MTYFVRIITYKTTPYTYECEVDAKNEEEAFYAAMNSADDHQDAWYGGEGDFDNQWYLNEVKEKVDSAESN